MASCSRSCSICLAVKLDAGVAGNGLPVSLAVQNVGIVIQTVSPIGLFESLLLHAGDSQQVAMRLRVGRSAENFPIVEDHGLQIHAYKLPEMRCYRLLHHAAGGEGGEGRQKIPLVGANPVGYGGDALGAASLPDCAQQAPSYGI